MDAVDFPKLHEALRFAVKAHSGQDREGPAALPYATHPVDVLTRLRYGAGVTDEDCLCAAVLHDVVEECGVRFGELESAFGKSVSALVRELTRHEPTAAELAGLSKHEVWVLRTRLLLEEISRMSPDAKRIKLADRCSNLAEARKSRTGEKLFRYVRQSRWILDRIDRELAPALWDEIARALEECPLPPEFESLEV